MLSVPLSPENALVSDPSKVPNLMMTQFFGQKINDDLTHAIETDPLGVYAQYRNDFVHTLIRHNQKSPAAPKYFRELWTLETALYQQYGHIQIPFAEVKFLLRMLKVVFQHFVELDTKFVIKWIMCFEKFLSRHQEHSKFFFDPQDCQKLFDLMIIYQCLFHEKYAEELILFGKYARYYGSLSTLRHMVEFDKKALFSPTILRQGLLYIPSKGLTHHRIHHLQTHPTMRGSFEIVPLGRDQHVIICQTNTCPMCGKSDIDLQTHLGKAAPRRCILARKCTLLLDFHDLHIRNGEVISPSENSILDYKGAFFND
ncbi:hypothetical protein NEF87_004896 [Candidatus Lokiarchaeum ossiferum]|uniref:Uncharacterized protein n=1 Tax=Candidatus Lokiarchaeum ossiferum TaxID=2951803 RepID=A0ABY6HYK5_9ARCH|nr:hypothetical protein NEF87_004896 [Candidatus Lokiarchaeum sp. B-35]